MINVPYFNVKATLECGQVFRYSLLSQGVYGVVSADKYCIVHQKPFAVGLETDDELYFLNYFDTATDYAKITDALACFDELKAPIEFCRGLRILRQDLVETIISFIVSANNHIKRITRTLNGLSEQFGERLLADVFAFPSLDRLEALGKDDFFKLGAGYRAEYLENAIRMLCQTDILQRLRNADYQTARKALLSISGVGAKVADCILLFALGFTHAFPVDTWIFNSLKTAELNTPKRVHEFYSQRYGAYGGYAQQFVFYYNREKKARE